MTGPSCTTYESGLGRAPFAARGADLDVRIDRLAEPAAEAGGAEQMLAVLEGAVRVVCPDEEHELAAGEGLLIPAEVPHTIEPLGACVLYRVRAK